MRASLFKGKAKGSLIVVDMSVGAVADTSF